MKRDTNLDRFLHEKREKKRLTRLHRIRDRHARAKNGSSATLYDSDIIDALHAHSPHKTRKQSKFQITIPPNFSIIDDPENALAIIYDTVAAVRNRGIRAIRFDHAQLQEYDLAAEEILDIVAVEARRERKTRNQRFKFSGRFPRDERAQRFIWAVGIIRNLGLADQYVLTRGRAGLQIFEMRSKRLSDPENLGSLDFKSKAVKDFVDHIDSCLLLNGRTLTPEARWRLSEYTGEIITNAEDHSGTNECMIVGYLDNNTAPHLCEVAIFNFGKSLAETLEELPNDSFTRNQIAPYLDLHARKNLFSRGWQRPDLLTLMALQGDVSRKNLDAEGHRGQGTVDLISFFQQVHHECSSHTDGATMVILSGQTYIKFDGTYKMGQDALMRSIIAFNKGNSLSDPPDKRYVRSLEGVYFPGTVISIRFPLEESQTREVA